MKVKILRRGFVSAISLGAVFLAVAVPVGLTQPSGVTVTPLAPVAQFDDIHSKAISDEWQAQIKTQGVSDLHVVEVTIQPGGTIGWHHHVGPSFVVVKSGTATFYQGADPTCTPQVLPAGSSLFEPGGDVHIVRNEGSEPLVNVVVQLIPTGTPRLVVEPSPGNCPF